MPRLSWLEHLDSRPLMVLCGLLGTAGAARGQEALVIERPQVTATRIQGVLPTVDGRLDEAVWQEAEVMSGFTQRSPNEGAPSRDSTHVRILYGDDALYVGARMYASVPGSVQAPLSRRDAGAQADYLVVALDTYLDRRTSYNFGVTAAGVRLDWYNAADRIGVRDYSFDPVWEAKTQVDSLGWTAEMRIPYTQLRFNAGDAQTWGINLNRWNPSRQEDSYWIVVPPRETGWASRFGDLVGIRGVRPSRRIELLPYVAGNVAYVSDPGVGNPFVSGRETTSRFGGDLKVGLGPNLTLEGTVNPDFGQVEADPAVVNLTAFETTFPEKRPFFTEGGPLLRGEGQTYFYTRRIGAAPVVRVSGDYVDYPETSRILGAAKLTGRLPSGTSVGVMSAVTSEEHARVFDEEAGATTRFRVAPRTAFGVGRVQQQFGASGSTFGVSLTAVRRDLQEERLRAVLNEEAYTGGADWNLRFNRGEYEIGGYVGFSHVRGDVPAIRGLQRASARYFQRPDADHVSVDSSATSLSGYTARLEVARNGGRHWLWNVYAETVSPGFELNDAGLLTSADDIRGFARLRYRETRPGPVFQNYEVSISTEGLWNYGWDRNYTAIRTDQSVTWKNFWTTGLISYVELPAQSDVLTRGGPLMGTGLNWLTILSASSRPGARVRGSGFVYGGRSDQGYENYGISGDVTFRLTPRWQLSVSPEYDWDTNPRQWIGLAPRGPAETFGQRYIFAFIERSRIRTQFRFQYAMTPDLGVELYAEPFATSGRYYDYGELPAAGSRDLRIYGTDGTTAVRQDDGSLLVTDGSLSFRLPPSDFNVLSFRSNAVLRWEWRPGSTLFLVWQQNRSDRLADGRLVNPRSLYRSFEAEGDNVLALKVTYWLPIR